MMTDKFFSIVKRNESSENPFEYKIGRTELLALFARNFKSKSVAMSVEDYITIGPLHSPFVKGNSVTKAGVFIFNKLILEDLKTKYPEWRSEYLKRDAARYMDRADTIERLLDNSEFIKNFGSDSFATSLAVFIDSRNAMLNTLRDRASKGKAKSITASDNVDLLDGYNKIIYQLKGESNRFAEFYNRFFDGDSLSI